MNIGVPREIEPGETRVALTPTGVEKLVGAGLTVTIEPGLGSTCRFTDEQYQQAGASLADRDALFDGSALILRLRKPPSAEVARLQPGSIHISFLDPFNQRRLVDALAKREITAISMEMIPRTTRAQKMDALSSQANLAGYVSVILGADHLDRIFPMMTTPAGTLPPARVFVIGAGVAGLQAIATAKRLGAVVEAYDTREVVAEQVRSVGGRFVKIDVGETGQTKDGYAKALTEEQLDLQRQAMARYCAGADVVITTAQLFGRPAPRIVTSEMVRGMRPGSVIVDLAVESGGNVEGSKMDEVVEIEGVRIVGLGNLPGRVCVDASQVYSNNLVALLLEYWDQETASFNLDLQDEILQGCVVTHGGKIVHSMLQQPVEKSGG